MPELWLPPTRAAGPMSGMWKGLKRTNGSQADRLPKYAEMTGPQICTEVGQWRAVRTVEVRREAGNSLFTCRQRRRLSAPIARRITQSPPGQPTALESATPTRIRAHASPRHKNPSRPTFPLAIRATRLPRSPHPRERRQIIPSPLPVTVGQWRAVRTVEVRREAGNSLFTRRQGRRLSGPFARWITQLPPGQPTAIETAAPNRIRAHASPRHKNPTRPTSSSLKQGAIIVEAE
jgi:hypothetical protein